MKIEAKTVNDRITINVNRIPLYKKKKTITGIALIYPQVEQLGLELNDAVRIFVALWLDTQAWCFAFRRKLANDTNIRGNSDDLREYVCANCSINTKENNGRSMKVQQYLAWFISFLPVLWVVLKKKTGLKAKNINVLLRPFLCQMIHCQLFIYGYDFPVAYFFLAFTFLEICYFSFIMFWQSAYKHALWLAPWKISRELPILRFVSRLASNFRTQTYIIDGIKKTFFCLSFRRGGLIWKHRF